MGKNIWGYVIGSFLLGIVVTSSAFGIYLSTRDEMRSEAISVVGKEQYKNVVAISKNEKTVYTLSDGSQITDAVESEATDLTWD